MSGWLDPLRSALDASDEQVRFFFRDDDAGWDDDALETAARRVRATRHCRWTSPRSPRPYPPDGGAAHRSTPAGRNDVAVHQHGFAHVNHEPEGRKCEFGVSRSAAAAGR